jgi:hypothetical protein
MAYGEPLSASAADNGFHGMRDGVRCSSHTPG